MSPDLWLPVFVGPLDDLVDRIHRRIEQYATEAGVEKAFVEIELLDGARYKVESLAPEPGYGFVTIHPHPDDDTPALVVVPVGSIKRIEIGPVAEQRGRLGFSVPESKR